MTDTILETPRNRLNHMYFCEKIPNAANERANETSVYVKIVITVIKPSLVVNLL